jgi:hypothetical protein
MAENPPLHLGYNIGMTDLDKARKIVAKRERWVGQSGALKENIAKAVAEGIALGRREGLEVVAKSIGNGINQLAKPPSE